VGEFRHAIQTAKPEEGEKEIVDTSKTYVKMCEKAIEIQQVFPTITPDDRSFWVDDFNSGKSVWLPRQDQLQEMVKSDIHPHWQLNSFVDAGISDYIQEMNEYAKQFSSMEQLWLALVMREKYSKIWNGEVWEEQK
jgi:hypothetical protein